MFDKLQRFLYRSAVKMSIRCKIVSGNNDAQEKLSVFKEGFTAVSQVT